MRNSARWLIRLLLLLALVSLRTTVFAAEPADAGTRKAAQKTMNDGNFKDAYDAFRKLCLDKDSDPKAVSGDLNNAVQCLRRLNRVNEIDAFREEAVEVHAKNWRLLQTAAQSYMQHEHYGYMIAGEFQRGRHRGGGQVVNASERDRIRALQLMQQAIPLTADDPSKSEVAQFYLNLSNILLNNRGYAEAWRLQYLSDLNALPDFDPGWGYYGGRNSGAPVDAEGNPVYHHASKTWQAAETDGQRWRWALNMAVETSPSLLNNVRYQFADFLWNQFGVQTMAQYGWFFGGRLESEDKDDNSGTYELHTLGEQETIARLAVGIRRFELPDEFNFVLLLQQIVADDKTGMGPQAADRLAQIFENRRQYPKAADTWRAAIKKYGGDHRTQRLAQIVDKWGRFEQVSTQPAGQGATVEFRFRNGDFVALEAHEIKVPKLLADLKTYLKSNPAKLDWQKVNIGNIGYLLVHQDQSQYVGERVAQWDLKLDPAKDHFDRRVTINTPLQKAGAYLVTAKMRDGNVSKIILWVSDTAIVKKPTPKGAYYYVADAVTGKPVGKANVELFGYRQRHLGNNKYQIDVKNFAEHTDADGQLIQPVNNDTRQFQWIATATTDAGRFAYLGFTSVWSATYHDSEYNQVKVFTITDRPVYRPDQSVKFKFWVRHAQYDKEDTSQFADKTFSIEIHNPKGEKVLAKSIKADKFGGLEGEYLLPADATLGVYQLYVKNHGGGAFRVEEYKKPEFEVTVDAPTEPIMLGEKITATINAKYYFGSPVVNAKVKYKVLRTSRSWTWYPVARWDWLFGRGYWWFCYDYNWYPGWSQWGCEAPYPWWVWRSPTPPEVVAEREAEIGPDGTLKVEIDTAVAKAIHPDQDHSYQIVVEVVDQSRRTIVGQGDVLVARKPFKVFSWVNRGYFRVGDAVRASFSARTLDDKPVQGKGELTLLAISYDKDNQPVETPVRSWVLDTDAQGQAELQLRASQKGQYRLRYKLTDSAKHTIEGGYVFTIIGEGFDGSDFRFNDIELIPNKRDYEPGEKVKLQVNTNRIGASVLLFVRPSNGAYLPPQVVHLEGKSTEVEIDVSKKDMPNFFVEALTIHSGKVHTTTRELFVPPEKRVMDVVVMPTADTYKPGEKAKVEVRITDEKGRPFVGSTVLAIYDKSVEYISGGSNVPEIKEFFWKWRRQHREQTESSLARWFGNMTLPKKPGMNNLGVFGGTVADELGKDELGEVADGAERSLRMQSKQSAAFAGNAAPMAQAAQSDMAVDTAAPGGGEGGGGGGAAAPLVQPTVRTKFADTALWKAALETNSDGVAEVELEMPENLTTWKIRAWGMGHGTRVGEGTTEVVTRKDLIIRLQAPRFFVEKDEVVLSANVHNYLDANKDVQVSLELDGPTIEPMGELTHSVTVEENGEKRIDWRVKVVKEGEAVVRMKALTDQESDAMQMEFPVYVHGMLKMESYSGALRPADESGKFEVRVPAERRINASRLEVRYSPTLAGAMVDALPYLIDYPYGCTEQTLNRFLPAVITQQVLINMGLDLKEIKKKRTNLNAQEIGDDRERAKGWKRYDANPVFDEAELAKIVKDGVARLTEMQLSDGGWGWFSGWGEHSYAHTTAVVVHGLQIAQANDVALVPGMLDKGVAWLKRYQDDQVRRLQNYNDKGEVIDKNKPAKRYADNLDALVFMVLTDADVQNGPMLDFLYRDRTKLAVYSNATYGLALHTLGEKEKLVMIMKNISQFVVEDDENQTAYLNLQGGSWWYWYGSEYEAHAYYLKLLSATDPQNPVASRMVKYLLNNRKHATYWNSTRDTALVVEAMADYLKASGEDKPDMTVEVWLDGEKRKEVKITAKDLFMFDNKFVLTGDAVETGVHTVELKKKGTGPLYYNGYMTNFTLEDYITKAGLEVKVERKYFKLTPVDKEIKAAGSRGQVVNQKVEKYEREELVNLATLTSGDLVEIEMVIESKNDYEYILVEDMKAAGFEPVEVRSGYNGNAMGAYVEFRDNRVAMFVRTLARGKHSLAYRMRAEIPGKFSALPTKISAMYAPELKGNSDEIKLKIAD
jgi:hypothetical protein